jgi:hypothetical protein
MTKEQAQLDELHFSVGFSVRPALAFTWQDCCLLVTVATRHFPLHWLKRIVRPHFCLQHRRNH